MEIQITIGEAVAVVLGETFSFIWYCGLFPGVKGSYKEGDRAGTTGALCGIPLALILQMIIDKQFVVVKHWMDTFKMSLWITFLYTLLVAPHSSLNEKFAFNILHKFLMLLLMTMAIYGCKDIKVPIGRAKIVGDTSDKKNDTDAAEKETTEIKLEHKKDL